MKTKLRALLFAVIFLSGALAFAAGDPKDTQNADKALKAAQAQIAEDAAFIRKVNSDPKMTPDQKKIAIMEFIRKQNEKAK